MERAAKRDRRWEPRRRPPLVLAIQIMRGEGLPTQVACRVLGVSRDRTQQLVGWLQHDDITVEQFILALTNARIRSSTVPMS